MRFDFQLPSNVSGWLLANTFPPSLLRVGPTRCAYYWLSSVFVISSSTKM